MKLPKNDNLNIRIDRRDRDSFRRVAGEERLSLTEWVTRELRAAVKRHERKGGSLDAR